MLKAIQPLSAVAKQCNRACLQIWADQYPELVEPLVTAASVSRDSQSHALDLLTSLAAERSIRDEILRQSPLLLNDILIKATSDPSAFVRLAKICIALLRYPLPVAHPLPAPAQGFFRQLLDRAIAAPGRAVLEALITLADGACEGAFDLPQTKLDELRKVLDKVLVTTKGCQGLREHLLGVYSLNIFILIDPHFVEGRIPLSSGSELSSQMSVLSMSDFSRADVSKYFSGELAETTVHVCSVLVIFACSPEKVANEEEAVRIIQLARRAILAMDAKLRYAWVSKNKPILDKAHKKIGMHTARAVQLEAMAFMTVLRDLKTCNESSKERFNSYLLGLKDASQPTAEALVQAIRFYAQYAKPSFWRSLFGLMVSRDLSLPLITSLSAMLGEMSQIVVGNAFVRTNSIKAISSMTADIHAFLERAGFSLVQPRRDFEANLISHLIICFMLAPHDDEHSLPLELVNKQARLAATTVSVKATRLPRAPELLVADLLDGHTTQTSTTSNNWLELVKTAYAGSKHPSQAEVIQIIGDICRDLETRCDTVEQPLRQTHAELDKLNTQYKAVSEAHEYLQAQMDALQKQKQADIARAVNDKQSLTEELQEREDQNARLRADLDEQTWENSRLADRNGQLCERIRKYQDEVEEAFGLTEEHLDRAKRAEIAQAEIDSQVHALRQELGAKDSRLEELSRELCKATQSLKDTEVSRTAEFELHQAQLTSSEAQSHRSAVQVEELKECLDSLKSSYQADIEAHGHLRAELEEQIQALRNDAEDVQAKLTSTEAAHGLRNNEHLQVRATIEKALELRDHECKEAKLQLESIQIELRSAHARHDSLERSYVAFRHDADAEAQRQASEIDELKQRLCKMTQRCHERQVELDRAQEMRSNMMKLMGVAGNPSAPAPAQSTIPGTYAGEAREPNTASRRRSRLDATHANIAFPAEVNSTSQAFPTQKSSSSSSSTEPTPKRQRQRRAFKVPLLKKQQSDACSSPSRALRQRPDSVLNLPVSRRRSGNPKQANTPYSNGLAPRRQGSIAPVAVKNREPWEEEFEDDDETELGQLPLQSEQEEREESQGMEIMSDLEDEGFGVTISEL